MLHPPFFFVPWDVVENDRALVAPMLAGGLGGLGMVRITGALKGGEGGLRTGLQRPPLTQTFFLPNLGALPRHQVLKKRVGEDK